MKLRIFSALLVFTLAAGQLSAQHSDVEFGYEGGLIEFETAGPAGIDAATVFEADFEVFPGDGTQIAEDPGFATNFMEGMEAFEVTVGDSIFVNVNQSQTLGSFLTYFNPVSGMFESTSATFTIEDNSPTLTTDLIVSEGGLAGDLDQFVATSTGAEIDSHVDFILSSGAQAGAYGLLLNISTDNLSGDLSNASSENFWVVFNNGLTEEVFEESVAQFQVVPEPSALGILSVGLLLFVRRNRK